MPRKYSNDLTANEVRLRFAYNAETGVFHRFSTGKTAGYLASHGYTAITIGKKGYLAHRLAWLYVYGEWPQQQIDHIDGNPINNAINNLREASDIENHQNTLCKGFYWAYRVRKYQAQIVFNRKRISLGLYDTPESARAAYEAASIKYFGEFSAVTVRGVK